MNRTDRYRNAHAGLVKKVKEISGYLDPVKLRQDATQVRTLLSAFFGNLRHHLGMEDRALYPELMNSTDPDVKSLAEKFHAEMGGIRDVVEAYAKKWSTASAIQADPSGFVQETKSLFDALATRIEKENNELYVAADKLAA
jgi:hemerythrin-like domain-containing protein